MPAPRRSPVHKIDLKPNDSAIPMQFSDRREYARLAEWARLNENREQISALKRGLYSVLPSSVLSLFTATELERVICGVPFIDVDLLKRHTGTQQRETKTRVAHV